MPVVIFNKNQFDASPIGKSGYVAASSSLIASATSTSKSNRLPFSIFRNWMNSSDRMYFMALPEPPFPQAFW